MISKILNQLILQEDQTMHDINHFMKVWGYAKLIGELEQLDEETQTILEISAIIHDIDCPYLRKTIGNTDHTQQEIVGKDMAREFLEPFHLPQSQVDRICYLVGHHHTYTNVDDMDYQILLEADFLVNADEHPYNTEQIQAFYHNMMKTESGKKLLHKCFLKEGRN